MIQHKGKKLQAVAVKKIVQKGVVAVARMVPWKRSQYIALEDGTRKIDLRTVCILKMFGENYSSVIK